MPPGPFNPADLQPHRDDSIARLLEKMEAKLEKSLESETGLRKVGFTDFEERHAEFRGAIELLRRALADESLAEDARIETFRVQANETRAGAIWMLTAPTHLRDPLLRTRWCAEKPEMGEFLDEMLTKLDEARGLALAMLPKEDVDRLREQGFLLPGE